MIVAIQRSNGNIIVQDNNKYIMFDNLGKAVTCNPDLTSADLANKQYYKALSVLSSGGVVQVGVFDNETTYKEGTLSTAMNLSMKRGYIRRLILSGTEGGISYTQTIFIYHKETDLGEYVSCI